MVSLGNSLSKSANNKEDGMTLKTKVMLGGGAVGLVFMVIAFFSVLNWTEVGGNEQVVVQDWKMGVQENTLGSGTHFYVPLTTNHYKYNIGVAKMIMGDQDKYGQEKVDFPAFSITVGGNGKEQPAEFHVTLQYRLNPTKLVDLHNSVRGNYEELLIKPALTRIISDLSTQREVLDFYSGSGRVDLQNAIEKAIATEPSLSEVGIVVETFVFDAIELDNLYVEEIRGRQIALQKRLRAIEETKAAEELANKAEAEANADKLKRIVAAEATKEERIRAAQAKAQEVQLAATADAIKVKAAAEADRFRKEQDAAGVLALGMAQAKVDKEKKISKYEGVAGERQAAVEIEQAKTERLKNAKISGVISEKTFLLLSDGAGINKPNVTIQAN